MHAERRPRTAHHPVIISPMDDDIEATTGPNQKTGRPQEREQGANEEGVQQEELSVDTAHSSGSLPHDDEEKEAEDVESDPDHELALGGGEDRDCASRNELLSPPSLSVRRTSTQDLIDLATALRGGAEATMAASTERFRSDKERSSSYRRLRRDLETLLHEVDARMHEPQLSGVAPFPPRPRSRLDIDDDDAFGVGSSMARIEERSTSILSFVDDANRSQIRPGAYSVAPGRCSPEPTDVEGAPPPLTESRTLLLEASLVDDIPSPSASLLVEAQPIRRRRQIAAITLAFVALLAAMIGLSVGLSTKPALETTEPPTMAPTSQLDMEFLPTLPPSTADSLRNASTPQSRAYRWVTKEDQVPQIAGAGPGNRELMLERMKQRFVLATLFYATGGNESWKSTEAWMSPNVSECEWSGCDCNSDGGGEDDGGAAPSSWAMPTITNLTFMRNRLEHMLPREIGLLTHLRELHLEGNFLTGSIPTEVGQLTGMYALTVSDNQLSGTLPKQMGQLTKLTVLRASSNRIVSTIPTQLGLLTHVVSLRLQKNYFSGTIPTELGTMASLQKMMLWDNVLTGPIPTELGRLSRLTTLDLSFNALNSTLPTHLGMLTSLNSTLYPSYFGNNHLTGTVPAELCEVMKANKVELVVDCEEVLCNCSCNCSETTDYYYDFEGRE